MSRVQRPLVVDTNVPLIANGKSTVSPACRLRCTKQLRQLVGSGHLVIDDRWLILKEYMNKLSPTGQPGMGDAFLKWVLTHQSNQERCTQVAITPSKHDDTDFREFPALGELAGFDRSDRKFVAVACAHQEKPPIWQGFDSKWWGYRHALNRAGVTVVFLCEDEIASKYADKIEVDR